MATLAKSCRLCLYRFTATILLFAGVVLIVVGLATSGLFISLLKGGRASARRIDIFFGLFSSSLRVEYINGTQVSKAFSTDYTGIEASKWTGAQALSIFAVLTGLLAATIHILVLLSDMLRKWYMILIELILYLLIVSFVIASVALVETHLYFLNAYGDRFLLQLLRRHDLLRHTGGPLNRGFKGPMYTYWVLVAGDFCFLLAFLSCLPEFIAVIDEKRRRNREKKEREGKPTPV